MTTPEGEIKDLTIPWLFQDLRSGKKTGTLVFSRAGEVKKVYLRSGEIMYASSSLDTDTLGSCLLRAGKISREQLADSLEIVQKSGRQLGAVLIERRLITPPELVAGAKQQVKQIVQSLFLWHDGSYSLNNGPLPLAEIVPLQMNTGALLFEGLRDLDWKVIRKSLPPLKTVLRPTRDLSLLLEGIELEQDHRTVLTLINGGRSIEELCTLSEIGDFSTLKALYLLLALRLAEVGGAKTAEEVSETARDITAEEKQEPEAQETLVSREMIQHAYDSLAIQDYYEMLGVGRSATSQEIRNAYFSLAKIYHPDRHSESELTDMKQLLETLFVNINEAHNVLSMQAKRDQYNLDLASGTKKYKQGKSTTVETKDSQKGSALVQFNEGMKQYRVQNFWGAEEAFRWAVRLDPSNPDYVYHQGLALSHMPRRRHEAEEYFQKALQMAPSKIEYTLELGNFYAKNGLKVKALALYQEALKQDPNSEKIRQALQKISG
jgi:Flp pilus assembly protein TadD